MLFSGTRPARARPRGSVWTIPILTDAASSDSAVQEFEVPGHSVLKFRMNVSGGDSGGKLALLSSDRFRSIDGSSQLTHPTVYPGSIEGWIFGGQTPRAWKVISLR